MKKSNQPYMCSVKGCSRQAQHRDTGLCHTHHVQRDSPAVIRGIRPTGETRRSDGQSQVQYTDGRQTWWAVAEGVAAA